MNFNLLRPVIFADLKVGEVLQAYSGLPPTVAYKAPAFAVLKFEDGSEGCYEIYKLETSYKLVPLCWVENKPVYPGDGPLYYKDNPAWRHNEEGVFASSVRDDELHFHGGMAFPINTATWTKPEQKREPSFQVEGQDVFPHRGAPHLIQEEGLTMTHFTEEQLQELATIFGLTRQEDLLPVRDGFVTKETMVWWRCEDGPILVKAGDLDIWDNIKDYPHVYQLKQPNVRIEYED